MNVRRVRWAAGVILLAMVAGCAETKSVQAVAPAHQEDLTGPAPASGAYSLYRAVGFDQDQEPVIERIWTVNVSRGQKMGFHWVTDRQHQWDPQGAFHLQAFADGNTRDLGAFVDRDVKYVWAASNADIAGYFHSAAGQRNARMMTMQ